MTVKTIDADPFNAARGGRVLIALWISTLAILVGTAVITFFSNREELLGNIAFSLLPAAILLNVSIVLSHFVENGSGKIARAAWISLCVAVIIFVSSTGDPNHPDAYRDSGIILAYSMLTLSFPIGFVAAFLLAGIDYLFGFGKLGFYISNFIAWFGFLILGYLQWFKLVPYLINKLRK